MCTKTASTKSFSAAFSCDCQLMPCLQHNKTLCDKTVTTVFKLFSLMAAKVATILLHAVFFGSVRG